MPTKFVQHSFSDYQSAEWPFEAVDGEEKLSFALWRIIHFGPEIYMDSGLQVEKIFFLSKMREKFFFNFN